MCDYSILAKKTRAAKVGDDLVTQRFVSSIGFADVNDKETAVCVLPGTEIAFTDDALKPTFFEKLFGRTRFSKTAIFRQQNTDQPSIHHDAVEFEDGTVRLLTLLEEGKRAVILQLPVHEEKRARVVEPSGVEATYDYVA